MAFIRLRNLKYDQNGKITSGSAYLMESVYTSEGKYHSRQVRKEILGHIIALSDDRKSGIFQSPTRGLIAYDSVTDTFSSVSSQNPRLKGTDAFSEPLVHTVFGDAYLFLEILKKSPVGEAIRAVFPKDSDYQRLLAHLLHSVLKDSSKISCDNFIEKSFASYILDELNFSSLRSDSYYFSTMGDDQIRMKFFRAWITTMREINPDFGKGCYVDSTPLPNDIEDNPFNALCCHGVSRSEIQTRLVLVLDDETGLPVWYDIIPGNVLDFSTIMQTVNDVAVSLNIEIESFVLDAGYVCQELIRAFHIGTEKTIVARMPAKKGYPFKTLYHKDKTLLSHAKYDFVRKRHAYFGRKHEVEIFGEKEYAYVYVDRNNALQRFRDYLLENGQAFNELLDREKDWISVKYGYFVLLSNIDTEPDDMLDRYFERTEIETVFKSSKEYLELLPLSKWHDQTVRGKILSDIIATIILLDIRKRIGKSGISASYLFGKTQSLMCFRDQNHNVIVETPNKKTKEYYKYCGIKIPSSINTDQYKEAFTPKSVVTNLGSS